MGAGMLEFGAWRRLIHEGRGLGRDGTTMRIFKAFLFVAGMVALAGNVSAGSPGLTPKIALHVSAPAPINNSTTICSTWSPNAKGIPCSDYVVEGPVGQNLLVYVVVAQV